MLWNSLDEEDLQAAAQSLGECLAHIHSCPVHQDLPVAVCQVANGNLKCTGADCSTISFTKMSSLAQWCRPYITSGCIWQAQDPDHLWSTVAGHLESACADAHGDQSIMLHGDQEQVELLGAWYPFISFLRFRRARAVAHHRKVKKFCGISSYLHL